MEGIIGRIMAGYNLEVYGDRGRTGRAAHRRRFWGVKTLRRAFIGFFPPDLGRIADKWQGPSDGDDPNLKSTAPCSCG
jgi:hypothetical protein